MPRCKPSLESWAILMMASVGFMKASTVVTVNEFATPGSGASIPLPYMTLNDPIGGDSVRGILENTEKEQDSQQEGKRSRYL